MRVLALSPLLLLLPVLLSMSCSASPASPASKYPTETIPNMYVRKHVDHDLGIVCYTTISSSYGGGAISCLKLREF